MKRGIVMEAGKKWVTVLTPEGEFCRIRNGYGRYLEGQEIFFLESASQPRWTRMFGLNHSAWREWGMTAAVFAILLLLFIPLLQGWLNPRVIAYVSVDINPSMEIGIDRDFRVIEAYAYNPEGDRILAAIPWKGEALATVTSTILDEADKQGYFIKSNQVLISTIPVDLPDNRSKQQINEQIDQVVKQRKSLHVVTLEGNSDIHDKAKNEGLSPGKYVIWQALQDSGVNLTREQMKKQSLTSIGLVAGDIDKVLELVNQNEAALIQPENSDNGWKGKNIKNNQSKDNPSKDNSSKNNKTDDNKTKDHGKLDKNEGKKNGDNNRTVPGKRTHSPSSEVRIPSSQGWNPISELLERHAKEKKPKQQNKDSKKKDNQQNNDDGVRNDRSHQENERNSSGGDGNSQGDDKESKSDKDGETEKSGKNDKPSKPGKPSKPAESSKQGESNKPDKPDKPAK